MAHSLPACARLGRLVARAKEIPRATVRAQYAAGFMKALAVIATPQTAEVCGPSSCRSR